MDLSHNKDIGPTGIESLVKVLRGLKQQRLKELTLALKHVTLGTKSQQYICELQGTFPKAKIGTSIIPAKPRKHSF